VHFAAKSLVAESVLDPCFTTARMWWDKTLLNALSYYRKEFYFLRTAAPMGTKVIDFGEDSQNRVNPYAKQT